MKASQTRVNQGGLMRCCLHTLGEYVEKLGDEEVEPGMVVSCAYESDPDNQNMILGEGGVWRWNRP